MRSRGDRENEISDFELDNIVNNDSSQAGAGTNCFTMVIECSCAMTRGSSPDSRCSSIAFALARKRVFCLDLDDEDVVEYAWT